MCNYEMVVASSIWVAGTAKSKLGKELIILTGEMS